MVKFTRPNFQSKEQQRAEKAAKEEKQCTFLWKVKTPSWINSKQKWQTMDNHFFAHVSRLVMCQIKLSWKLRVQQTEYSHVLKYTFPDPLHLRATEAYFDYFTIHEYDGFDFPCLPSHPQVTVDIVKNVRRRASEKSSKVFFFYIYSYIPKYCIIFLRVIRLFLRWCCFCTAVHV